MIEFSQECGFWSMFVFWFVALNLCITLLLTVATIVGGLFDLKFLFKAMKEEVADESDDGRVVFGTD